MAYGSPATEADIAPYYTHIRGGHAPSSESLEDLTRRYRAIGRSPLSEITRAQATALSDVTGLPTFVGMKHAPPFIADGAAAAQRHGVERLVGLPLAPHFARMSIGAYEHSGYLVSHESYCRYRVGTGHGHVEEVDRSDCSE